MTLVLLTPIGLDDGSWREVKLPPVDLVTHVFPGFGGRARLIPAPDMAQLADEVVEAYEGPLDLVGVSMGGMVAQNIAVRHPGRVNSLLTACTGAASDPATMHDRAATVESAGMAGVLDTTLERWFTTEALSRRPQPAGVIYARDTLLALDPEAFADGWRAIATHDVRGGLPDVRVPTTCIAGDADAASPVARGEEIARLVPNCRFVVLAGPHMMHLENPEGFGAALVAHLGWARGG
ncbi:MAG TPA: alpha/beta hydrolase [Solirubrobacteraceae bacterium]|nr:alpha/beta hydrolase [Solirubrobacteraceae bacterium]